MASEPRIDPAMPLFVEAPNGVDALDLPDYYEPVFRFEYRGYTPRGHPSKRQVQYAVRPLTAKERSLLAEVDDGE